jgi:two-component system, NarL family, response regulator
MLVDDHAVVRMGLAAVLEMEADFTVVAEADDGLVATRMYAEHQPDITLMDVRMPAAGGVDAVRAIRQAYPAARIIMLSTYELEELVSEALDAGASGYLLKSVDRAELVDAIRRVHDGGRCLPAELQRRMAERQKHKQLSGREREVLSLMRRGLSNKEIAASLGVSENTAKVHVKGIFLKLQTDDRAEAVAQGFARGFFVVE